MDANKYIEEFEDFLSVLQEENKIEAWERLDGKNYALKIISPADNITTINPFWEGLHDG